MFKRLSAESYDRNDVDSILASFREPLRRYFLRRVHNMDEAEDLTQELLMRMVRKFDGSIPENPEAFLFSSAANLLKDRGRRQKTAKHFLNELTSSFSNDVDELSPDRVLDSREFLRETLEVLNGLDEKVRSAFILNRLEGMKYKEIARLFGMSASSIEKYVIKAQTCLAQHAARARSAE